MFEENYDLHIEEDFTLRILAKHEMLLNHKKIMIYLPPEQIFFETNVDDKWIIGSLHPVLISNQFWDCHCNKRRTFHDKSLNMATRRL